MEPAEPELSWLYLKLMARTDPALLDLIHPNLPIGTPMPSGNTPALTEDHLQALRLWIRGGGPEDGVVEGTAELLGTCLPEPTPLKVAAPKGPPRDANGDATGVQLRQTPWPLGGVTEEFQGEDEICMATYYDLSEVVPDWARIPCPPEFVPGRSCSEDASPCETDADCSGDPEDSCDYRNLVNTGSECFVYHKQTLLQDPQSHHSILQIYRGAFGTGHESWGPWTYKIEPKAADYDSKHGLTCDPLQIDPEKGYNPGCSGRVFSTLACAGFGPPDVTEFGIVAGGNLPQFLVSQEPFFEFELANGVYSVLPIKGIMTWNSHAFNLSSIDTTMAQYLNMEFARTEDQLYQSQEIFHADWIFAQNVMPFEKQEVCATYTAPRGANIFQLTSHTHLRGNRFRIWAPPNEPCQPPCPDSACADATDTICFCENSGVCSHDQSYCSAQWDCNQGCDRRAGVCIGDRSVACERKSDCVLNECLLPTPPFCTGPRADDPFYFSTEYSDPLQLFFDPPLALHGQSVEDRTFLYCSQFDNGSAPGSPPVKQQSTSPVPPELSIFGLGPEFIKIVVGDMLGGPCNDADLFCLGGANEGMPCGGDDSLCGEGGVCDACPAHGGVTTDDEMFILIGGFFQETTTTTTAPTTTAPTTTTTSPPRTAPPTTTTSTTLPHGSRIGVCHKGRKMLSLPSAAVPAHLGHGDTIGSCNGKASERGKKKRGKGR